MSYYKMVNIRRLGAYRIFPRSFSHTRLGLRPRRVFKTTSGISRTASTLTITYLPSTDGLIMGRYVCVLQASALHLIFILVSPILGCAECTITTMLEYRCKKEMCTCHSCFLLHSLSSLLIPPFPGGSPTFSLCSTRGSNSDCTVTTLRY